MDRLKETAYNCRDKRRCSQEEYITPSCNLKLIIDEIRDNDETNWNKEDSPTPAPEPSKNRDFFFFFFFNHLTPHLAYCHGRGDR